MEDEMIDQSIRSITYQNLLVLPQAARALDFSLKNISDLFNL